MLDLYRLVIYIYHDLFYYKILFAVWSQWTEAVLPHQANWPFIWTLSQVSQIIDIYSQS